MNDNIESDARVSEQRQKRISDIQAVVAGHFLILAEEVSQAREPDPTWQQKVAIYVVHNVVPVTDEQLGDYFKCNAFTIAKSVKDIKEEISRNKKFAESVSRLVQKLTAQNIVVRKLNIEDVMKTVARYFEIDLSDLTSQSRERRVARPRQIAMYLAKEITRRSTPTIGTKFGGRDHTTVMHGIKRIQDLCVCDPDTQRAVADLRLMLTPFALGE